MHRLPEHAVHLLATEQPSFSSQCTGGALQIQGICVMGLRQELVEYRAKYFTGPGLAPPPILALGLSSRKNLCVHPSVAGAACQHPLLSRFIRRVSTGSCVWCPLYMTGKYMVHLPMMHYPCLHGTHVDLIMRQRRGHARAWTRGAASSQRRGCARPLRRARRSRPATSLKALSAPPRMRCACHA